MPPLYQLTVLTPERRVYEARVESLVAPGWEGSLGVLARHAPMMVELSTGELKAVAEGGTRWFFAVSGGLLEVTRDGVIVLADAAEPADQIDLARARAAEERARQRLRSRDAGMNLARAEAALRRALNRERIAARRRSQP